MQNYTINNVKPGDTVTVERTFVVSSTDTYDGIINTKDGRKIRVGGGSWYTTAPLFTITKIEKAEVAPAGWGAGPKAGQVWEDSSGYRYMIVEILKTVRIFTTSDEPVTVEELKKKTGLKLILAAK